MYVRIDIVGACVQFKISECSKITGQRLDAVKGLIIYWQIQTINQIDRSSVASSDSEQRLNGWILLRDQ